MSTQAKARPLFDPAIVRGAIVESFRKLNPRVQVRNPVMFVVLIGSILTTFLFIQALLGQGEAPAWFIFAVSLWLWFTVLFANFAEAMAEGRGKAQAESLRKARRDITGRKLLEEPGRTFDPARAKIVETTSAALRKGDLVLVSAGEFIPSDAEIVVGIASVDESAITGESAPVIREAGGDRSAVTGGTRVLSDWIVVRITSDPGETFLDRMIAMVEGAKRQKTPNEIALNILLAETHDHLPPRHRHAAAVLHLRRERGRAGNAGDGHRPGRAPRLPDPDDDRRPPLGDRDRRHGPDDPGERHRDLRARRRGRGRRGRAAARQDGDHHARQPAGDRVPPERRDRRAAAGRRRAARVAGGRDPRGTQRRRPGEGAVRHPRARRACARRLLRALHGPDPDERRRSRRPAHSQGGRRGHRGATSRSRGAHSPSWCASASRRSRARAARRSWWQTALR